MRRARLTASDARSLGVSSPDRSQAASPNSLKARNDITELSPTSVDGFVSAGDGSEDGDDDASDVDERDAGRRWISPSGVVIPVVSVTEE